MSILKRIALLNDLTRRTPVVYGRYRRTIAKVDSMPFEQRCVWQDVKTRAVLRSAAQTAYGRRIASEILDDWPILEKSQVQSDLGDFLTATKAPTTQAATGGSTGQPLELRRSWASVVAEQASIDHLCAIGDLNFRAARVAVLRGDVIKDVDDKEAPFWTNPNGNTVVFSARHLTAETLPDFVSRLTSHKTDCLFAYPSAAEQLCRLLAESPLRIRIPFVVCSSEMLSIQASQLVRATLSANLLNYYGQGERVAMAYQWNDNAWRFLPSYGRVQFEPVENGFEIIATGFWNHTLPLVRYRTNDLMAVERDVTAETLQKIAVGQETFDRIEGRSAEYLVTADGARIIGLNQIARDAPHVSRIQLIQRSHSDLLVNIAETAAFTDADHEVLRALIGARMPASTTIEIRRGGVFMKTAAGKTPFVVREL